MEFQNYANHSSEVILVRQILHSLKESTPKGALPNFVSHFDLSASPITYYSGSWSKSVRQCLFLRLGYLFVPHQTIRYRPAADPAVTRIPATLGWKTAVRPAFTTTNARPVTARTIFLLRKKVIANPAPETKSKLPRPYSALQRDPPPIMNRSVMAHPRTDSNHMRGVKSSTPIHLLREIPCALLLGAYHQSSNVNASI